GLGCVCAGVVGWRAVGLGVVLGGVAGCGGGGCERAGATTVGRGFEPPPEVATTTMTVRMTSAAADSAAAIRRLAIVSLLAAERLRPRLADTGADVRLLPLPTPADVCRRCAGGALSGRGSSSQFSSPSSPSQSSG